MSMMSSPPRVVTAAKSGWPLWLDSNNKCASEDDVFARQVELENIDEVGSSTTLSGEPLLPLSTVKQ